MTYLRMGRLLLRFDRRKPGEGEWLARCSPDGRPYETLFGQHHHILWQAMHLSRGIYWVFLLHTKRWFELGQ